MRGRIGRVAVVALIVIGMATGAISLAPGAPTGSPPAQAISSAAVAHVGPVASAGAAGAPVPSLPVAGLGHSVFDERVLSTERALAAAGISPERHGLPYIGAPAVVRDGAVVPGELLTPAASEVNPLPQGVAYYGENDTGGLVQTTTIDASTVAGQVTVNQLNALYMDTDNPDFVGVQLNDILGGVTLQQVGGYQYWTQNTIDYILHNNTIALSEDTWNFSSGGAYMPSDNSTLAAHSPNGSVVAGLYIGFGPFLPAPRPFTLSLYVNSSVTASGDQVLWYNYSLAAHGEPYRSGSYDWLMFNSTNAQHPGTASIAPFIADGSSTSSIGVPLDYEMDFGIGSYNGASMTVLSANASATLDYCPATIGACTPGELRSVPAATDYGAQTGETGVGLAFTYQGTTAYATAGPEIPQGLWGYPSQGGTVSGATVVRNAISVSGAPDPSNSTPYVWVFLDNTAAPGAEYAWAPDVPEWDLMPGNYTYDVMLSNYAEQAGTLIVGSSPTSLTVTLPYSPSSGVYTPLWALNNSQLAGISYSGSGSVGNQYALFNDTTHGCSACGGASDGNLSLWFFSLNDYYYPTFPGLLLNGTSAYVDLNQPVSFQVFIDSAGLLGSMSYWPFDLPIALYDTSNATIRNAAAIGGWPAMFPIIMVQQVPSAQNPFPQADAIVWNSHHDLLMSDHFIAVLADNDQTCVGTCPQYSCAGSCESPDALMLYGGSENTVWGNDFEDPPGAPLLAGGNATFAGLAEAENGDLLYNNNFSIDNPVMFMAYDPYNDSCPASYAGLCLPLFQPHYSDTWNVSNQSASNVAETVNGFPLSGNVLGPRYADQGGNYWWNWGDALNPFSTLPYVNEFDYTDYQTMLPPGSAEVEASIPVGGDFVPLRLSDYGAPGYVVQFSESGLAPNTPWSVSLGSTRVNSTTPMIQFTLPNGTYDFTIDPVPGYSIVAPSQLNVTVNGTMVLVPVSFLPLPTVSVTFAESGLPSGTGWSVVLNSTTMNSSAATIVFPGFSAGTYNFTIAPAAGYDPSPAASQVTVSTTNVTVNVSFSRPAGTYTIEFLQSGLPNGTAWTVVLNGTPGTSSGTSVAFVEPNGTYAFTVPGATGYLPNPGSGNVTVAGAGVNESVAFTAVGTTYPVSIFESGLATNTQWSVVVEGTVHGGAQYGPVPFSSTSAWINVSLPNGSYTGTVSSVNGYTANASHLSFTVAAAPVRLTVGFSASGSSGASGPLGLALWEWAVIGVVIVLVILGAVAALAMRGRRPPPAPASSPPPAT